MDEKTQDRSESIQTPETPAAETELSAPFRYSENAIEEAEAIDCAHIDEAIARTEAAEKLEAQKIAAAARKEEIKSLDGVIMSQSEFSDLVGGGVTMIQQITQLKALDFDEARKEQARDAYGALYEVIRDCPSVRWILNPASEQALRYWRIGSFFIPVTLAVSAELRQRRIDRAKKTVQMRQDEKNVYQPETVAQGGSYNFAAMAEDEKRAA